jgi:hypothetical protein
MEPRTHPGNREVTIPAGRFLLQGTLAWPCFPSGLVILGRSGRMTPADRRLAHLLRAEGMSTLLLDLLAGTAATGSARNLNVWRGAGRLRVAAAWAGEQPEVAGLPRGYLGLGDHAATVLAASTGSAVPIGAVVAGGGRPDRLGKRLAAVQVPTCLIAGSQDAESIRAHRAAMALLSGPGQLVTIRNAAGPPFEAADALNVLGRLAASWFVYYLALKPRWRHRHGRDAAAVAIAKRCPARHPVLEDDTHRTGSGLSALLGGR